MGHEKDVPCVFCGGDVAGTVWVLCSACEVPCHKSCWDGKGACPVFGCGATQVIDPATALFRKKTPVVPAVVAEGPAVALRREIDALTVEESARQDRQAKAFGVALAGWALSLILASSAPSFYVFGAAWFLVFLGAAGVMEVRGWMAKRRRRELEKACE